MDGGVPQGLGDLREVHPAGADHLFAALILMWEKYSITPREVFFWNSFWSWERPIRLSRQIWSMGTWLLQVASR